MSMLSYNLSDGYQIALLKQQAMLNAARELRLAAQAAQLQKESRLARQFRLMFRVRRVLFRVAPRMARFTL